MKKLLFLLVLFITGITYSQKVSMSADKVIIDNDTIQTLEHLNIFKINLTDEIFLYTLFQGSELLLSDKTYINQVIFGDGKTQFITDDDISYTLEIYNGVCYLTSDGITWIGECEVDFSRIR